MLTKIIIRNFKRFGKENTEIPLGNGFVFVGPNNSGKTSALQALALWHAGLQKWVEKRIKTDASAPKKRIGITVNRKDLVFLPTVHSNVLWHNKKVISKDNQRTRIELTVHSDSGWKCGLEFDYANEDTFHCRPLRINENADNRMNIPKEALGIRLALVPPLSGLATEEPLIQPGRINVLLGQGRTAEVLRNICYSLAEQKSQGNGLATSWEKFTKIISERFGITPQQPIFNPKTGDIKFNYKEGRNTLEIQSAGRGAHQMMLLLAFLLYHPPGTVFLLDEPDAHLETLRQSGAYQLFQEIAAERRSQIIVASHSEKLLDDAVKNESAVAFIGHPKIFGANKSSEIKKSLTSIGWHVYYEAEIKKWVLYLEGESDLKIMLAFAEHSLHQAREELRSPFVSYVRTDKITEKLGEFSALKMAEPKLRGLAIMDSRQDIDNPPNGLDLTHWKKTEIENYLFSREVMLAYAVDSAEYQKEHGKSEDDSVKFLPFNTQKHKDIMNIEIQDSEDALNKLGEPGLFSVDKNASKRMEGLLKRYAKKAKQKPLTKKDFHSLVKLIPVDEIDPEITEKLDLILNVANAAKRERGDA